MSLLVARRRGGGGSLPHLARHHCLQQAATFVDAKVNWVRDRGLDHAVEKEKHLRAVHALKNLLLRHYGRADGPPSDSLPLSAIAERRDELRLPFRAIRFVRKYPSAFLEELPSPSPAAAAGSFSDGHLYRPHVRATPELVRLHEEEQRVYESCRAETADRLLRLLMLSRRRRLPLDVVDRLRWDLGLPDDYVRSLLPDYPDYFQIVPSEGHTRRGPPSRCGDGGRLDLELVCWNKELAVSAMERWAMKTGGYKKGAPLAFPLNFSRGFDMEKKVRLWVQDWQRLPYISPYEDASHLDPGGDLAEKWIVGVLHELLHLLVPKKTERDDLLFIGEWAGLPRGFKRVLAHHPGIFYVSNKIRMRTVVLREAYKRDLLVEKHPLMGMRYQYIHLLRQSAVVDASEAVNSDRGERGRRSSGGGAARFIDGGRDSEGEEDDDDGDSEDEEDEFLEDTDFETEDESDNGEDEKEEQGNDSSVAHGRVSIPRRMSPSGREPFEMKRIGRSTPVRISSVAKRLETSKASRRVTRRARSA